MKASRSKAVAIFALSLSVVLIASSSIALRAARIDPCDSYGDCVSASIAYTRANPDDSLYLGDQFSVILIIAPGSGAVACGSGCAQSWSGALYSTDWSYDQSVLRQTGGSSASAEFMAIANVSGSYTVTGTASFLVSITTCATTTGSDGQSTTTCSASTTFSLLSAPETVTLRAFSLDFETELVNATTPAGQTRRNPDGTFYPFDAFHVNYAYSFQFMQQRPDIRVYVTPTYDQSAAKLRSYRNASSSGDFYYELDNKTGSFGVTTTATALNWLGQKLGDRQSTNTFGVIPLIIDFGNKLLNVTDAQGQVLRNPDGTFYRNDSFSIGWNASFKFSDVRADIRINVTSVNSQFLRIANVTSGPLGRNGSFGYVITTGSPFQPSSVTLRAEAFNFYNNSLALTSSTQPYAVVQYDPKFTSYAYMMYGNSTASRSLQRPWVLLVRYEGNLPGYSYAGDKNTHPFNGSRTLSERAFFSDFRYSTLSYQPYISNGVFGFHVVNGTGTVEYNWLDQKDSAPLYYANRIEKYLFNATASSLSPLLARGFIYQNVTMVGCWQHEDTCDLRQNYWLVPFLWNGRLNIVSVDSNGNEVPGTPITLTMHNPAPLDSWLTSNFERVFGNDSEAIRAFEADLYPTNQTMSFSGSGELSVWFNQTSLSPPTISITAGSVSLGGSFTFVPTFVNSAIASVPNSLDGKVYYANATIPLWSYNMVRGSLSFLPISTTIEYPSTFLELVNSSGWLAGDTTAPQTPSAFASQRYGFWPLGGNLTIYANIHGGGIKLLGTQKVGPNEYQASFYIEPWSGRISSVHLVEGDLTLSTQSTLNTGAYPSPLPPALTGLYSITYPASGQDTKVVFTNVWGATTTIDLGTPAAPAPLINLIPATTVTAFGVAFIIWFIVSGILKTRKAGVHE